MLAFWFFFRCTDKAAGKGKLNYSLLLLYSIQKVRAFPQRQPSICWIFLLKNVLLLDDMQLLSKVSLNTVELR